MLVCVCRHVYIYICETVDVNVSECETRVCGYGSVLKVRLERQRDLYRVRQRTTIERNRDLRIWREETERGKLRRNIKKIAISQKRRRVRDASASP